MSIKIIQPGMLSTVQDLGRFGVMKNGFTQSGAMDSRAVKKANRLVGNALNCAVIEMTMTGITAELTEDCIIALSGGDFGASLNSKPIRTNKAYKAQAGSVLTMGYAKTGLRAYLAVSGGIDVEPVMGSRSTNLKSGIGGFCGRKLMSGDILETGCDNFDLPFDEIDKWELPEEEYENKITVRAVAGPQDFMFTDKDIKTFFSAEYEVTPQSDRMGFGLDGAAMEGKDGMDIISDGIVFGSVQIPKNGKPIILMADHQTTGGYAKIATVISADLPLLAQAKPKTKIRFHQVSVFEAERLSRKEKRYFDNLFFY